MRAFYARAAFGHGSRSAGSWESVEYTRVTTPTSLVTVRGGSHMALTAQQIAEQRKHVEELIAGSDVGFAKALFFGKFKGDLLFPYPTLPADKQAAADEMAAKVQGVRRRAHRPHADRPRRPHPRFGDQGPRGLGVYQAHHPDRVRRPRASASSST